MVKLAIPEGDLDVLAIGETVVDFISDEQSERLREVSTFRRYLGGSPANVAVHVAKLGGRAAVVSKTGAGAFGSFLRAELRAAGVDDGYLVMDGRVHTTLVFIARSSGTPEFQTLRGGDAQLEPRDVPREAVRRARVVHASTFALSRPPARYAVERAFEMAREADKLISLDPNYSPVVWPDLDEARRVLPRMLGYAAVTKPSLDDCRRFFGDHAPAETYLERFHELGPQVVVLTMGAEGILLSHEGHATHLSVPAVDAVDATGAGDAFWAAFLVALLDGNVLERCARFAREIVIRKLSTVGPVPGIIDREQVYRALDRAR